ncbi:MAG: hypothetical protein IGS39_07450 [Calothrix sp. C42_A2020_038]|nr:hypothetical protein [Calothrix sp. C42_A2020_038]
MSQNPLMHPGSQFSKTPSLKPPLAAALASLEVQLDRELARYRRTRTGGYRASNQSSKPASIGIKYLAPVDSTSLEDKAYSPPEEKQSEISTTESLPKTNINRPVTDHNEVTTTPPPPPPPPSTKAPVTIDSSPQAPTTSQSQNSGSSIVPVNTVETESSQNIASENSKDQPDDYLESSEALLRSLTEEAPKEQKKPTTNDSLLSPLGIGSILLLLMASIILGYVIINPKSLPQFSVASLFKRNSNATNTDSGAKPSSNSNSQVAQPQLTPIPRYPNLAKDEFPEVNSPNDVVGLKPKPKPTPTTPPENPLTVVSPVPSAVVENPAPATNTPTSSPIATPTPTKEIPISDLKPSADGFYHIVIDNSSQSALTNARKLVPDAYLSPDGKLIYLGAIKNKEKAQALLNEIRAKGINARIRQP